jgi:hypothetical protein
MLTDPVDRLMARKRSVRESAAMDTELRQAYAELRRQEMLFRQGGAQPPQYADLQKFDSGVPSTRTPTFRSSGDAR